MIFHRPYVNRPATVLVSAIALLMIFAGAALARGGTSYYNSCHISWSNARSGTFLSAHTNERSGCARVQANIYYRNGAGNYVTTTYDWVPSNADAFAYGNGVHTIHRADDNFYPPVGVLYESF